MDAHNRYREEELEESTTDSTEEEVESEETLEETTKEENLPNDDELEELKGEVKRLNEALLRNRADLENFKRRTQEERIKERKYAHQDIFEDLLEVISVFDSAVNVETDDPKLKKFLIGFKMVNKNFNQVLEKYGVKRIDAINQKFDHHYHEAIGEVVNDELEPGTIVSVQLNGYCYKDRVLRPSRVVVSKKSNQDEKSSEEK